ncbi:MAG: DUF484 family protein [Acetobacteraceae bacterium]|nr:DUF484 family protein [Acetobacteraceae bacterium]
MQPTRDMAGFAEQVCAFLRAHPAFLAENPELYRVLLPPARVHGADLADHMAAMLAAQRAHAQAMQDEADRVLAAGRAQAGAWARVQEAVLALIESRFPIDCIATEFPRLLAVDAANLCAEAPILAARRLSLGSIATLFGARSVVFEASEAWAQCLHGEASGLAQHQVLIRIPGHDALLALAARDAALLDPAQGQACWLFLARAVAAAVSR